jgi:hypothetical protein
MPLSNYEICLLHWVQYHVCLLGRVDTLPMFIIIIINFMLLVSLFLSYTPFNYILLSLVAIYSTNYSFFLLGRSTWLPTWKHTCCCLNLLHCVISFSTSLPRAYSIKKDQVDLQLQLRMIFCLNNWGWPSRSAATIDQVNNPNELNWKSETALKLRSFLPCSICCTGEWHLFFL